MTDHAPTLALVSEQASHIAFINGKTYSREEVLRAVNAHHELLDACKYLLLCHKNDTTIDRHSTPPPNPDAIRLAEQAIAKAEGK